jgi:hypothetical protein
MRLAKICCDAETVGIMILNGEQIIIYNEVVVACLQMISLCDLQLEIPTTDGSKGPCKEPT